MRWIAVVALMVPLVAFGDEVNEPRSYWTGPINSPTPATIAGGTVIHSAALAEMLEQDANVVLVDVSNLPKKPEGMPADVLWMPPPQEVIPGADWMPNVGLAEIDAETNSLFRDYLERETGGGKDRPVVIYCHENCWLSWNAARRAISYGYRKVYWFPEGIEGWRAAGFTTAAARPIEPKRDSGGL